MYCPEKPVAVFRTTPIKPVQFRTVGNPSGLIPSKRSVIGARDVLHPHQYDQRDRRVTCDKITEIMPLKWNEIQLDSHTYTVLRMRCVQARLNTIAVILNLSDSISRTPLTDP